MTHCLKVASLVLAMGFAGFVGAEEINSEYQHQAGAGKMEATPSLTYGTIDETQRVGPGGKATVTPFGVVGEYGIDSMMSVGLELGYQMATFKQTGKQDVKIKGMTDPVLKFKSRFAAGPGVLKAGIDLALPLEKNKVEANGDQNAATGGLTATPFVGYEMAAGPGVFGARFNIDLYRGDRKTDTAGVGTTETGGMEFALTPFYEWSISPTMTLGGALSYINNAETTTKDDAAGTSKANKDNSTTMGLKAYLPMTLSDGMVITPALEYATLSYGNANSDVSKATVLNISVAARFTF